MAATEITPRRSGRKRTRSTRYSSDLFINEASPTANSEADQTPPPSSRKRAAASKEASDSASEFGADSPHDVTAPDAQVSESDFNDDDDGEGEEEANEDPSAMSSAPDDDDDGASEFDTASRKPSKRSRPGHKIKKPPQSRTSTGRITKHERLIQTELHARRLRPESHGARRDFQILDTWGDDPAEHAPLIRAADKWWFGQTTLPLRLPNQHGSGGFAESFFMGTDDEREAKRRKDWEWYFERGGRSVMTLHTRTKELSAKEARRYLLHFPPRRQGNGVERLRGWGTEASVLFGPAAHQYLHRIPIHGSLDLHSAWAEASAKINANADTYANSDNNNNNSNGSAKVSRPPNRGWALNIGETVHLLDWAPNRNKHAKSPQYLALSTWPKKTAAQTSAFTSCGGIPASVQIWAIYASLIVAEGRGGGSAAGGGGGGTACTIDTAQRPRLALALCFDWGLVKDFKWCPVPWDAAQAATSGDESEQGKKRSLGLLAIITGDGKIRVLDVEEPAQQQADDDNEDDDNETTEYRHYYSTAAFEICPPDTICTCLTWISARVLAAGCANGYVAIWDISTHLLLLQQQQQQRANIGNDDGLPKHHLSSPFPFFYHSLHTTFVRSVASCHPSRPHLLATTAMDGFTRLTDIRAPKTDSVFAARSRIACPAFAWHEQSQHVMALEETSVLKSFSIRAFFKFSIIAHFDASAICIATSPVHPFVLVGTADGVVSATNPLRRIIAPKRPKESATQKWFRHDWRRGKAVAGQSVNGRMSSDGDADEGDDGNGDDGDGNPTTDLESHTTNLDFPAGLIRLTTGYAPHAATAATSERNQRIAPGIPYATIHEEWSGARSVAWNPNASCGGWAAAGMGSGIVVIEDLALDR